MRTWRTPEKTWASHTPSPAVAERCRSRFSSDCLKWAIRAQAGARVPVLIHRANHNKRARPPYSNPGTWIVAAPLSGTGQSLVADSASPAAPGEVPPARRALRASGRSRGPGGRGVEFGHPLDSTPDPFVFPGSQEPDQLLHHETSENAQDLVTRNGKAATLVNNSCNEPSEGADMAWLILLVFLVLFVVVTLVAGGVVLLILRRKEGKDTSRTPPPP